MATAFEPIVEFPPNPNEAACIFFGVLAYPKLGEGQPGRPGCAFSTALYKFQLRSFRRVKGLSAFKKIATGSDVKAPEWREIKGPLHRGTERILRRMTAYSLYGSCLLTGFFRARAKGASALHAGAPERAFVMDEAGGPRILRKEILSETSPSVTSMLAGDIQKWSRNFGMTVGAQKASVSKTQKADRLRDLRRRGWNESVPVLHMAHALEMAVVKHGPNITDWTERNPILALAMNAPLWVQEAIEVAETWRQMTILHPDGKLRPDRLVELSRKKVQEFAP